MKRGKGKSKGKNRKRKVEERGVEDTLADFCDAVAEELEALADVRLSGVKISDGVGKKLLRISLDNIDEHVRLHSALVAYWTAKEAEVKAVLKEYNEKFEVWEKLVYRRISRELSVDYPPDERPTIMAVKSEIEARCGKKRSKKLEVIRGWERRCAYVSAFCEGLRQKGFSLQQLARMSRFERDAGDSV